VLRRERRTLLKAREDTLRDLGGLLVEMYRRGGFRDDLLQERAEDLGRRAIVALGEIDELLHASHRVARCECGTPILRRSSFCPNSAAGRSRGSVGEQTVIEPAPKP
jgi:hypothetical protein